MACWPGSGWLDDVGFGGPEPPWPGSASEREVFTQRERAAARRQACVCDEWIAHPERIIDGTSCPAHPTRTFWRGPSGDV